MLLMKGVKWVLSLVTLIITLIWLTQTLWVKENKRPLDPVTTLILLTETDTWGQQGCETPGYGYNYHMTHTDTWGERGCESITPGYPMYTYYKTQTETCGWKRIWNHWLQVQLSYDSHRHLGWKRIRNPWLHIQLSNDSHINFGWKRV